jgi:hypothetical protein
MSISSVSTGNLYSLQGLFSQPRQDLQTLAGDLTSGNLTAAKTDFASFQKDVLNLFQTPSSTPPSSNTDQSVATGPAADLQALQNALNSNDVTGAQKALAAFRNDIQAFAGTHKGHHHHHHHHSQDSDGQSTQQTGGSRSTSNNTSTLQNGVPDASIASLIAAYNAFSNPATASSNNITVLA